jgi:hypothetical protein
MRSWYSANNVLLAAGLLAGLVLGLGACKPKDPIVIDVVPKLEWVSVSPSSIQAFSDSIVFRFRYTDGDGDLGTADIDARNLFLTDTRIGLVHRFRIPQLGPDNANVPITGTYSLTLPNIVLVNDGNQPENVTFSLYVTDRKGNQSNTLMSPVIEVRP